jgi:hypothetical protein
MVHWICVWATVTTGDVQGATPTLADTAVPIGPKFVPVIVRVPPPGVVEVVGDTDVTTGAS